MKYEVKGLFSYGVYDGDRLLGTYESEKSATLVCDALNDEAARVVGPIVEDALKYGSGFGLTGASGLEHVPYEQVTNGQDKETT
jgi:hypothetical protein